MAQNITSRLRARIRSMVRNYPDLVMEVLLNTPSWPTGLETEQEYMRIGDDDKSFLRIVFSRDGDAWPNVFSVEQKMDPQHWSSSPRYRTYFGGGQSLRTRAALCILAKAIAMDNAERPQRQP
jgi:hypothetical protein